MHLIPRTGRTRIAILAAILALLPSSSAFAAKPVDYDDLTAECIRIIDGPVTGTLDECAQASVERSDAEMRRLMISIEGILRERLRERLRDGDDIAEATLAMIEDIKRAQAHWRQERDALCRFRGRLMGPVESIICPLQQNILRVEELRALWTETRRHNGLLPPEH